MPEHHIQRAILYKLVTSPFARFAELKPKNIDGNIFTYHLKQLIRQKLVEKSANGTYSLTPAGKAVGIHIELDSKALIEQAHSILLICAEKDGKWLLRKRLAHPMYGRMGFVHGEPVAGEPIAESANRALKQRTNLEADFTPVGGGYIRIFQKGDLESFTHFTALKAENFRGSLEAKVGNGENIWLENPNFKAPEMIPSMFDIVQELKKPHLFFVELEYQL